MSRNALLGTLFVALLAVASIFAPAPMARLVAAQQQSGTGSLSGSDSGSGSGSGIQESPACDGLRNAYENCSKNGKSTCSAVMEQLVAHGCMRASGSGSSR